MTVLPKTDVEFVRDGVLTSINRELNRVIRERRGGKEPPDLFLQRPGGGFRVVLRYGYRDYEELVVTQRQVALALRRRAKKR